MKERIIWMLGGAILTVVVFVLAQQFLFGSTSAEQISQEEAEQLVLDAYSGDIEEVKEDEHHYSVKVSLPSGSYIVFVNKQSGKLEDLKSDSTSQPNEDPKQDDNEVEVQEPKEEPSQEERNESEQDGQEQQNEPEKSYLTEDDILDRLESEYSGEILSVEFSDGDNPNYHVEIEDDNEFVYISINAETGQVTDEQVELKTQTPISKEEAVNIAFNKQSGEIDDIEYKEINGTLYYLIEIETDNDQDVTVRINALNGEALVIWDDQEDDNEVDKEEDDDD